MYTQFECQQICWNIDAFTKIVSMSISVNGWTHAIIEDCLRMDKFNFSFTFHPSILSAVLLHLTHSIGISSQQYFFRWINLEKTIFAELKKHLWVWSKEKHTESLNLLRIFIQQNGTRYTCLCYFISTIESSSHTIPELESGEFAETAIIKDLSVFKW